MTDATNAFTIKFDNLSSAQANQLAEELRRTLASEGLKVERVKEDPNTLDAGGTLLFFVATTAMSVHSPSTMAEDRQQLILSESDYFNFAHSLEKSIPSRLINLIGTLGLLFIGYYPKRWEDRLIVRMLLEQSKDASITAIHGEASEEFIKAYWKYKKVESHTVKMSEFVEKLTAHLAVSEDSDVP